MDFRYLLLSFLLDSVFLAWTLLLSWKVMLTNREKGQIMFKMNSKNRDMKMPVA